MTSLPLSFFLLLAATLGGALAGAWIGTRRSARSDGALPPALAAALERLERLLRDEAARGRAEQATQSAGQRGELSERLQQFQQALAAQQEASRSLIAERLDGFAAELRLHHQRLAEHQRQVLEDARSARREQGEVLARFGETQAQQAAALRSSLEQSLGTLRQENAEKLEQMRRTVDEKLHETLERRLGESFQLVSQRLEQVHKGLGEMQTLASGVGDLKRVLNNVSTRGNWGEVQLEAILDQMLTAEQYARKVSVKPGSREAVDFAIRLPGRSDGENDVWLPIDAKFPREDFERLLEAQERADTEGARAAGNQLERAVRLQARSICDKYIAPPHTTDFAILFLPTEGLYAEVIRRPGIVDALQRECRVVVAGPTTFAALLNSLQMGFRTLAIEQRSSEVWQVLGAVKTEFGKFGDVLDKVRKKLDEATSQLDQTGVRSRAISRKLQKVQELPAGEAERLLAAPAALALEDDENS